MQTLLIVEDEKMIRQGIKAMVLRSGVPVDLILECSNGIDALNLLSERHVDVMFTDIRMQKMDGIELVKKVNEMEDKPLIVAISGYDDFSYAVEMLRNGVREYLLKPVERDKISAVLKKMDSELQLRHHETFKDRELGIRQVRELVGNPELTEEERRLIISKYEPLFFEGDYRVCVFTPDEEVDSEDGYLVKDTPEGSALVLEVDRVSAFLKNEFSEKCVGVGGVHRGLGQLSEAFREAAVMRRIAFVRGKSCLFGEDQPETVNANLKEKARTLLAAEERTRRIQLIGTEKTDDLIRRWKTFFTALESGQIDLPDFSEEMVACNRQILEVYREHLTEEDEELGQQFSTLHTFESLGEYQNGFMDWLLDLNKRLGDRPDDANIRKKIAQAKEFILDHYADDLNMAVVSNHVSMNYSLFSYSFKQYAGQNFVNYLKEIRIEKAKELLAETDMKIVEISQAVGYENEKNFMKIFKAICGVTPGEYRKNMSR